MEETCLFMESHRLRNRKSVLVVNCHFSRGKSVCFLYVLKKLELGLILFHIFMKDIKQGVHSMFVALWGSEIIQEKTQLQTVIEQKAESVG